jgi:hypothetical protein
MTIVVYECHEVVSTTHRHCFDMLHRLYEFQWLQGLAFIFLVSSLMRLYVNHAMLAECCVHRYEQYAFYQMIGH